MRLTATRNCDFRNGRTAQRKCLLKIGANEPCATCKQPLSLEWDGGPGVEGPGRLFELGSLLRIQPFAGGPPEVLT